VVAECKYFATRVGLLRHRKNNCHFDDGITLVKWQCVATHTVRLSEMAAYLDAWVTNTPSVKISCPRTKVLVFKYMFVKHNMLNLW
jgi:hypothetical protein